MDHQQIKTLKKRKKILQLHHRIALKQEKKGMSLHGNSFLLEVIVVFDCHFLHGLIKGLVSVLLFLFSNQMKLVNVYSQIEYSKVSFKIFMEM